MHRHQISWPLRISRRRFASGALSVTAALTSLGRPGWAQGGQVNVYNWDTYIGETTLEDFTEATGITVRYDLFASNEEVFAKLREGNPGYDVIFPTNDFIERMIAADMLLPLDHSKIPNLGNVDPAFADPAFDPGLQHSAPYFWGTLGLGYRASAADPKALADLFEGDAYAGRIALINSIDSILAALKYLGHSLNTKDPAEITQAADALIQIKPKIKSFAPDTGQDLLIAGEVDVCLDYNGDVLQVMAEDDDLSYVVPEEGSLLWSDAMCIPKGAPEPGQRARVHQFHPGRPGARRDRRVRPLSMHERRGDGIHSGGGPQRPGHVSLARGARALRVRRLQRRGGRGSVPGCADQGLGRLDQRTVPAKVFQVQALSWGPWFPN